MTEILSNDALGKLIDEELDFDATTSNGLTNHLPMALVAKAGLGATRSELERFTAKYRRRLVATGESERHLTKATWRSAIGESHAYVDLVDYFDREIDEHGVEETLRSHLDALVDGVSGAAFHGVIRLAYALDVASPSRVSRGLAYLASTAMTLGPLDDGTATSDDPGSLLGVLATESSWGIEGSARNIGARMRLIADHQQLANVAA